MKLPPILYKKIVNFLVLLPNIHDSRTQQALIYSAGLDHKLHQYIIFGGSSAQFTQVLVTNLEKYGTLNDGRSAIEAVLEASKDYVGKDKKAYCEDLLVEVSKIHNKNITAEQSEGLIDSFSGLKDTRFLTWYKLIISIIVLSITGIWIYVRYVPLQPEIPFNATLKKTKHVVTQAEILFEDNFADNKRRWVEFDNQKGIAKIYGGEYIIQSGRENVEIPVSRLLDIDQNRKFQITASITGNKNRYGLIWGQQDSANYYYFVVNVSDNLYVYGKLFDGNWHDIISWKRTSVLNEDKPNILSVRKTGRQVQFFINEQFVDEEKFAPFFGSGVGFLLINNSITIDSFIVTQ